MAVRFSFRDAPESYSDQQAVVTDTFASREVALIALMQYIANRVMVGYHETEVDGLIGDMLSDEQKEMLDEDGALRIALEALTPVEQTIVADRYMMTANAQDMVAWYTIEDI